MSQAIVIRRSAVVLGTLAIVVGLSACTRSPTESSKRQFHLQEATISEIQGAIRDGRITTKGLVELYLKRVQAYDGRCVSEPEGILGPITTIPNAGQLNSLSTLNLRPTTRQAWGFGERKARSMTNTIDDDPKMPDALEVAAEQDRLFAETGELVGPLHGVVVSLKDQYDTFDMRTTSGADAHYANDRPPDDATFVKRLRDAGAIILAKANMAEYASNGDRSSFGGVFCNPYDTERNPGLSSGGSGISVAANLVTCSIGEETGPSIRWPSVANNIVGISPTQELMSRDGMIGAGLNTRVGPMCRTVGDAARILDVIAGYDPKDELTAFSVGRTPAQPYASFAGGGKLDGVRIGVVREFMNRKLFTKADEESIDIVDRGIEDLRKLGATIVDPGAEGALFQDCIDRFAPQLYNAAFAAQFPKQFPIDAKGKPRTDQIATLLDMAFDPKLVPAEPTRLTIRSLGQYPATGEAKYMMNRYLRERGDANIKTNTDLANNATFYKDSRFPDRKRARETADSAQTLDMALRLQHRFAFQQIVLQCMQEQKLDALTYPTTSVPPPKIGAPQEPNINGRSPLSWTVFGSQGFPAITVPAGFTTQVYDRVPDPKAPRPAAEPGATGPPPEPSRLVGPVPARLPVGIEFVARPFGESTLVRIASAYEAATHHRTPPPAFGPLPGEP
ncbi:MAG TPA: amidase family protein [Vicinamibacterales bacterium]|jgi:Asp-tRNA(Asn)/Glu-tRNA(Gln) amidotransferase A subunit family amidase